jgi:hypothetical protein
MDDVVSGFGDHVTDKGVMGLTAFVWAGARNSQSPRKAQGGSMMLNANGYVRFPTYFILSAGTMLRPVRKRRAARSMQFSALTIPDRV